MVLQESGFGMQMGMKKGESHIPEIPMDDVVVVQVLHAG
jgi:hypothetical protein